MQFPNTFLLNKQGVELENNHRCSTVMAHQLSNIVWNRDKVGSACSKSKTNPSQENFIPCGRPLYTFCLFPTKRIDWKGKHFTCISKKPSFYYTYVGGDETHAFFFSSMNIPNTLELNVHLTWTREAVFWFERLGLNLRLIYRVK